MVFSEVFENKNTNNSANHKSEIPKNALFFAIIKLKKYEKINKFF